MAGLSRAQTKQSSEFTELSTNTWKISNWVMPQLFYDKKNDFIKKSKKILDISKAIRVFESPYHQGVHFIYQLLLFPFHLFSLTLFVLLCFIVQKKISQNWTRIKINCFSSPLLVNTDLCTVVALLLEVCRELFCRLIQI